VDLKQLIAQKRAGEIAQKLVILDQIAEGLSFAHAHEIVHRDLKPANIHLQAGQVKIMDFGLARLGGSEMTRTGMVMGTPHYMSPEQVRGERADTRSDVFALGCVAYELLTYRKPFDADSMHSVLFKVMQEEPPPLTDLAPDVPVVFAQVVERAMAKEAAHRFAEAGEFRGALHRAMQAHAAGAGHLPLDELRAPAGAAAPASSASSRTGARPAVGTGARAASRSGAGTRSQARPASRLPLYAGAAVAVVVAGIAGALFVGSSGSTPPPTAPPTRPAQVDALARELARTQVELAGKRFDAGDYADAAAKAESALKIDPANVEAQKILAEARTRLEQVEKASAGARDALAAGDAAGAAQAFWTLAQLNPGHPAAVELAPRVDGALQPRVDEARRLAVEARVRVEKNKAAAVQAAFREGTDLLREAESDGRAGRSGLAVLKYLRAQERFDRAERAVR
jgi:serine/threonine-protein kinase